MTNEEPSSTRLFNIPVILEGRPAKMLIYTNDLDTLDNDNALMIVPIPNLHETGTFGLVDVTKLKDFRKMVVDECDNLLPKTRSFTNSLYFDEEDDEKLMVHEIGNYDISVAKNFEELEKKIDWNHFNLPPDFEIRKKTLMDKTIYPFKCGYVIAKTRMSIKNDGFGIIYFDPQFDYFPTAHENNAYGHYSYDVKLYNFSDKTNKSLKFGKDTIITYHLEKQFLINHLMTMLPSTCTSSLTGKDLSIVYPSLSIINFNSIKSNERLNTNVIF